MVCCLAFMHLTTAFRIAIIVLNQNTLVITAHMPDVQTHGQLCQIIEVAKTGLNSKFVDLAQW